MSNETTEKLPIAPSIRALEIGEYVTFPVERSNTVRNTSTLLGLTLHKEFKCNLNEDRTTITVTRTA